MSVELVHNIDIPVHNIDILTLMLDILTPQVLDVPVELVHNIDIPVHNRRCSRSRLVSCVGRCPQVGYASPSLWRAPQISMSVQADTTAQSNHKITLSVAQLRHQLSGARVAYVLSGIW